MATSRWLKVINTAEHRLDLPQSTTATTAQDWVAHAAEIKAVTVEKVKKALESFTADNGISFKFRIQKKELLLAQLLNIIKHHEGLPQTAGSKV